MNRKQLTLIWIALVALTPIVLAVMLLDIVLGVDTRAHAIAIGFDEAGNGALGGDPRQTISARVGTALLAGKAWAKPVAAFIDAIFGRGHCVSSV